MSSTNSLRHTINILHRRTPLSTLYLGWLCYLTLATRKLLLHKTSLIHHEKGLSSDLYIFNISVISYPKSTHSKTNLAVYFRLTQPYLQRTTTSLSYQPKKDRTSDAENTLEIRFTHESLASTSCVLLRSSAQCNWTGQKADASPKPSRGLVTTRRRTSSNAQCTMQDLYSPASHEVAESFSNYNFNLIYFQRITTTHRV